MKKGINDLTLGEAFGILWEFYKEMAWVLLTGFIVSRTVLALLMP